MKQFFENYGAVALGILALLVLIAMITPVGNLVKTSLQGTVQTFSAGIESQSNAIDFVTVDSGTRIKIGDRHYIVIEKMGLTEFKVMETEDCNGKVARNSTSSTTYENSTLDVYLNDNYYSSLPNDIKTAIIETEINEKDYFLNETSNEWDRGSIYYFNDIGPSGWYYNIGTTEEPNWQYGREHTPIAGGAVAFPYTKLWSKTSESGSYSRKVYLPSVDEIIKLADFDDELSVYNLLVSLNATNQNLWLRDYISYFGSGFYIESSGRTLDKRSPKRTDVNIRPAYTLDLSKVSFTIE